MTLEGEYEGPEAEAPEPGASSLSVAVYCDGEPVFVLADDGRVYGPDQPAARAAAAIALAKASAALAGLPLPETHRELTMRIVGELAAIGTPAASDAIDALQEATELQAAALEAATKAMLASAPTSH